MALSVEECAEAMRRRGGERTSRGSQNMYKTVSTKLDYFVGGLGRAARGIQPRGCRVSYNSVHVSGVCVEGIPKKARPERRERPVTGPSRGWFCVRAGPNSQQALHAARKMVLVRAPPNSRTLHRAIFESAEGVFRALVKRTSCRGVKFISEPRSGRSAGHNREARRQHGDDAERGVRTAARRRPPLRSYKSAG